MAITNIVSAPTIGIIAAIVVGIGLLVAIIVLCVRHWDEIKEAGVKAWEWIKNAWDKVATWFSEKVIEPIVQFFTNLWSKITEIFGVVKEWFSEKFNAAKQGITNAFSTIGNFFSNIWSKITGVFSKVGSWFSDQFKQAVNNIKNVFSSITSFFSGVWTSIKNIFSKVGSAIGGAITNTVKSAINGVLSTAIRIINNFISAINLAISVINAIPGVNIKKLSKLSVPKLAKGGIVDSATLAVVGEQGKEAIVPLENNTEWIDKIVDKLGAKQGSTPIALYVDGKKFAETSINTINALTRQTGSLKLNLV
jgi:phage-related protein